MISSQSSQSSQESSFHLFLDVSGAGSKVLTPTGVVPLLSPNAADVGTLQSPHHQHSLTTVHEPHSHLPHFEPSQDETQTDEAVAHAVVRNSTGSPILVGIFLLLFLIPLQLCTGFQTVIIRCFRVTHFPLTHCLLPWFPRKYNRITKLSFSTSHVRHLTHSMRHFACNTLTRLSFSPPVDALCVCTIHLPHPGIFTLPSKTAVFLYAILTKKPYPLSLRMSLLCECVVSRRDAFLFFGNIAWCSQVVSH